MSDYDPDQKYAFYNADTFVLVAWGYFESSCTIFRPKCDIRVEVPWDFELEPGKWKWNGTEFEAIEMP